MLPKNTTDIFQVTDQVDYVALTALRSLVPEPRLVSLGAHPVEAFLVEMTRAAPSADPGALADVVTAMRQAQITPAQIAEVYIPDTARRLGAAWVRDTLPFGAVTIACARLQGLLRLLDLDLDAALATPRDGGPSFIVGVPAGRQHTLGAAVLAGQLRHRGLSVHLDLEMTPQSLGCALESGAYAAVLLSASCLESLATLVDYAKIKCRNIPVVVGGPVLEHHKEIETHVQADLFTSDAHEAIRFVDAVSGRADDAIEYQRAGE